MRSDFYYALRSLSRAPGFFAFIALVLALGIGLNSAIFAIVDQVLIRPLPYADPGKLAMLWEDFSAFGVPSNRVSPQTFLDWKKLNHTLADAGAYVGPGTLDLAGSGPPEEVRGPGITANLLPILGVQPLLGRTFLPEEEHENSDVVILSYRLWQRRYGGDPNLPGHTILMEGRPMTVVGIMPRGFQFPDRQTEFWVPLGISPQVWARRNSHFLKVVARTNASFSAARQDMDAIATRLAEQFPATNARVGIRLVPLKEELLGDSRTQFIVLLCAAGCVLLIACTNAGSLMLARAVRRRREIAIRVALGASRARLVRQLLIEGCMLSSIGGLLGVLFANWSMAALKQLVPPTFAIDPSIDFRVLAFACAISLFSGLLFSLAPASEMPRLTYSSRADGPRTGLLRDALIVAEVAIALVLLTGAGLLIQTLFRLRAVNPGFRADRILTAEINVAPAKNNGNNWRFYARVLERVRAIPGVQAAGLTSDLPYTSRGNTMSLEIEGQPVPHDLGRDALFRMVSAGYLETIGARLKEGRFLEARDSESSQPVVVVNETLAQQYFPGESALGHRIDTGTGNGHPRWMTIVGVVKEIRERGLDLALKSGVYAPFPQSAITFFQPSEIAVRANRDPLSVSTELQQAVWSIDPEQPVSNIRTMDAIVDLELANRTQVLWLLGSFAALALILAALGIYGLLAHIVTERTREIGLRIAIGATRPDVILQFLGYSARLTGIGLILGAVVAALATRLLSTLLYGVSPLDLPTFASVAAALFILGIAASIFPARRAASVDPAIAMRNE